MTVVTADPSPGSDAEPLAGEQSFVRGELVRRLFDGSAQSRYFSLVLWPVIAAIYWRQIDLVELAGPFVAHLAVTVAFDVLRHAFDRAQPDDKDTARWGRWFAVLSFLAGACWGVTGFILASKDFELQRMLLGLVLLAAITTAVPIRSAHPPTFFAFAIATTAPLLLVLLTSADPFYQLVGIAGGAYIGHLLAYVRDVHRWQYDNIALAYQKEDLARQLQVAYDEARMARDAALAAQRVAEAANQAKSTFLATVSHEIRTPMNGVLGMIDVMERTSMSIEQRESLGTVRSSAASLLRIIDDILDFSKIEAGHLDLEQVELSTIDLIEGVAETLAVKAAEKGLLLAAFVAPDVPDRMIGDPLRLQQILFNLLGNAIKFTERGQVRLVLERTSPADGSSMVQLRIRVSDTGIGLTPSQRERLFRPFVQADSSMTRRFGGTGLGLSIVRRLAEAMGGGVDVESEAGVGSTFVATVTLGAVPSAATSGETSAEPLPGDLPLHGLSVEVSLPDPVEAASIARYLADAGAKVGVATSRTPSVTVQGAVGVVALADLKRPWRRDVLVRAVAGSAGRPEVLRSTLPGVLPDAKPLAGRVLVVDDNAVNRKILARQLELAGATTEMAASGEEALQLWRTGGYDLVLADLQMPGMDGFELARQLRDGERNAHRRRTPILAVTASTLEEDRVGSRAAGMDGLVTKPIGIEQLRATLNVWLGPGQAGTDDGRRVA